MDKPSDYRIKVRGIFPNSWSDRMGDLKIVETTTEGVTLEGRLSDQAALAGILETLYELHLPILEVICLPEKSVDRKAVESS